MIERIDAYMLECDGCGELFESGESTIWAEPGDALDHAELYGWAVHRDDGKHYCEGCNPGVGDD